MSENIYLTTAEAAERLKVTEKTIRRWLTDGDLVGIKNPRGSRWLIPADALRPAQIAASAYQREV